MDAIPVTETQDIDYWTQRWKEEKSGWHMEKVNPTLLRFLHRLVDPSTSTSKKFFIPLCGKTHDIKYILEMGHRVFAVEAVKQVIDDLNVRDNLELRFNPDKSTYSSPENNVVIYVGDILDCPIEDWGPIDIVWDRASLIAMNYVDRKEYVEVVKRSIRKTKNNYTNFVILLETVCFEKFLYAGPPRSVETCDMEELFEPWTEIEILEKVPIDRTFPGLRNTLAPIHAAHVITYLLTPKK